MSGARPPDIGPARPPGIAAGAPAINPVRRIILEVRWVSPPPPVRRAVLEPGRVLRVGRTALADFRVPNDRRMSGVHFELSWDGERCLLRDREGAGGTWLDGRQVSEAEVKNRGWIRAGTTIFLVFFEGATGRLRPPDPPGVAGKKARALAALRAEGDPLFALLDAARDLRVLEHLRGSVEEHRSLYDGLEGDLLGEAAPYLVSLPRDGALLETLVREGWGESWGVYLTSRAPFAEVRRHFRRLLMVDVEDGSGRTQRAYFRFYDPRVLRLFLPVCTIRQTGEMFGAISGYLLEGEDGEVLEHRAAASPR